MCLSVLIILRSYGFLDGLVVVGWSKVCRLLRDPCCNDLLHKLAGMQL